jgi:hypothetical protein
LSTMQYKEESMTKVGSIVRTVVTASALAFVSLAAHAATINLKADLKASSEVPAKDSAGTGMLSATLDTSTHELKYHVEYSGMTGPVSAAHFHGPAAEGANAGPVVPVKGNLTSPIDGTATLTSAQEKDLLSGKWYFNLHTSANPGGEIRGQVMK